MPEIVLTTQANIVLIVGQNTEIMPARVGARKFASFQIQDQGRAWVKLGSAASVGDGVRVDVLNDEILSLEKLFEFSPFGTFYEGTVNVFWEGPGGNHPRLTVVCRVIEGA